MSKKALFVNALTFARVPLIFLWAVFAVWGELELGVDKQRRLLALEARDGYLLDDRVDGQQVQRGHDRDQQPLHFASRSIALWHSMHVSTNGWVRSRGLRLSCPQTVHTPF